MSALPTIMVAPNGARLKRSDHPSLPVSLNAIIDTALNCMKAGADGIHAHVRDANEVHVLDAALNLSMLRALAKEAPELYVQITTEAIGKYTPAQQRELVKAVQPRAVSVALREMTSDGATGEVAQFYHEQKIADVDVQHILYNVDDIAALAALRERNIVPAGNIQVLLVLGRYANNQIATPDDLNTPLEALNNLIPDADWAVCAFGPNETACLTAAYANGGKIRVGFENNLYNADGSIAKDNAERVAEVKTAIDRINSSAVFKH